jgi:hypothetical protein
MEAGYRLRDAMNRNTAVAPVTRTELRASTASDSMPLPSGHESSEKPDLIACRHTAIWQY